MRFLVGRPHPPLGDLQSAMPRLLFFLYGCLMHMALLGLVARRAYSGDWDPSFVHAPLAIIGIGVAGGISVMWFMLALLRRSLGEPIGPKRVLLTGGVYGVLASLVVVVVFCVAASIILTQRASEGVWLAPLLIPFFLMGIGTYAMGTVLGLLPILFLYGVIAGLLVLWMRRRTGQKSVESFRVPQLTAGAKSLALGTAGLLLILIPLLGAVLSLVAVILGTKAINKVRKGIPDNMLLAKAGIILGSISLSFWFVSHVIFIVASLGWFKGSP